MKEYDCSLPEFVIFDAYQHKGNKLNGRIIVEHIPSKTIAEAIPLKGRGSIDLGDTPTRNFEYVDFLGNAEQHLLAVHSSGVETAQIGRILEDIAAWLCDYWSWEDDTINKNL